MVRWTLVITLGSLGCASAEPAADPEADAAPHDERDELRGHGPAAPIEPPSICPSGAERHERGGEGPDSTDWWCARGEVRHGPFGTQRFDERRRTWSDVHGEYRDGQYHGAVEHEGFYEVAHSGSRRVFRREVYDHGRLVRSNEAEARLVLDAASPAAQRRFVVRAADLPPATPWGGEQHDLGAFDVEVSATWSEGPTDDTPSVLRVEVSTPSTIEPVRSDALLYAVGRLMPPSLASSLPFGELPLASAGWPECAPQGCEIPVDVTLRWVVPGSGQLDVVVTARAVPETWPEHAPVEVSVVTP